MRVVTKAALVPLAAAAVTGIVSGPAAASSSPTTVNVQAPRVSVGADPIAQTVEEALYQGILLIDMWPCEYMYD